MHISRAVNEVIRLIECNLIAPLAPDLSYRLIPCNFYFYSYFFCFNGIPLVLRVHPLAYLYARDEMKNKVLSFICIAKASFTWSPSFIAHKISFTRDVVRVVKSLFIRNEYWRLNVTALATGR